MDNLSAPRVRVTLKPIFTEAGTIDTAGINTAAYAVAPIFEDRIMKIEKFNAASA